jgi:hypothetical protein
VEKSKISVNEGNESQVIWLSSICHKILILVCSFHYLHFRGSEMIILGSIFLTVLLFVFILVGFTSCFYFWTHLLVVSVLDVFTSCFYFN